MMAAGLIARNANPLGLNAQALGQIFACTGLQDRKIVSRGSKSAEGTAATRFRRRGLCLYDLQWHERRTGPQYPAARHRS